MMDEHQDARANLRCLPWLAAVGLAVAARNSWAGAATVPDHLELALAVSLAVGAGGLCYWRGWARPVMVASLALQLGLKLVATGLLLRAGVHPLSALLPLLVQCWMLVVLLEPRSVALVAARGRLPVASNVPKTSGSCAARTAHAL